MIYRRPEPPVPPLFAAAPGQVRRDAPPTSVAAAESVTGVTGAQRRLLLSVLALAGERGLTDEGIGDATEIAMNAVRPRRGELVAAGRVRDSGRTRATRSGRKAIVWVVVNELSLSGGARADTPRPAFPCEAQSQRSESAASCVSSGGRTGGATPPTGISCPACGSDNAERHDARPADPAVGVRACPAGTFCHDCGRFIEEPDHADD